MELYEMVIAKVMKEGKKIGESGRVDSYKHPDRPDITVDVNQTDGSAEIYFDTDRGSKGYAKIDRDMETGGTDLTEAEEVYKFFGKDGEDYVKDVEEGISGGLENLDEFTRIKKAIGGPVQPYDPRASALDFAKAIDTVGAGTNMQKARAIQSYDQNIRRQNPLGQSLKNFGNTLTEGLQAALNYGSIPANFAAGITGLPIGYTTQQMRDTMDAAARASTRKGPEGGMYVGYGDLGAQEGPGGEFLGMNPEMTSAQRALALTSGDVEFKINPATGKINYDPDTLAYDFNQANPLSTGNKESGIITNFINQGGLMGQRVYTPMDSTFDPTMTQLESVNNIEKIARDSQYGSSTSTPTPYEGLLSRLGQKNINTFVPGESFEDSQARQKQQAMNTRQKINQEFQDYLDKQGYQKYLSDREIYQSAPAIMERENKLKEELNRLAAKDTDVAEDFGFANILNDPNYRKEITRYTGPEQMTPVYRNLSPEALQEKLSGSLENVFNQYGVFNNQFRKDPLTSGQYLTLRNQLEDLKKYGNVDPKYSERIDYIMPESFNNIEDIRRRLDPNRTRFDMYDPSKRFDYGDVEFKQGYGLSGPSEFYKDILDRSQGLPSQYQGYAKNLLKQLQAMKSGGMVGLKDGGSVDLTIITMPDISGSGVESLFKTR